MIFGINFGERRGAHPSAGPEIARETALPPNYERMLSELKKQATQSFWHFYFTYHIFVREARSAEKNPNEERLSGWNSAALKKLEKDLIDDLRLAEDEKQREKPSFYSAILDNFRLRKQNDNASYQFAIEEVKKLAAGSFLKNATIKYLYPGWTREDFAKLLKDLDGI